MSLLQLEILPNVHSDSIYLLQETINNLGYTQGEQITLSAGCSSLTVNVDLLETNIENKLFIPEQIYKKLNLPGSVKLFALNNAHNKQIKLGPFLGFLITRNKKRKKPPHSSQRLLLQAFSRTAFKSGVIPVVFSSRDIDWINQRIVGHIFQTSLDGTSYWQQDTFPLPDVVYNRILNRTMERKPLIAETIKTLKRESRIQYFNPRFLNKWETHQILISNPSMHKYLPETLLANQIEDIVDFLSKHSTVYIKPINGSLGQNIVILENTKDGCLFKYRKRKKNIAGIWTTTEDILIGLQQILGKRRYIVQQGLDLKIYRERIFDVRLLMQKNIEGEWEATSIVSRIAQDDSLFPNIAAGGEAAEMETVWQQLSPEPWEDSDVKNKILDLGYNVASTLENNLGTLAELGLDIGIGKDDNAWLIEVNAKPSRKVFPKNRPDLKQRSIQNIIDYARYLSNFTPQTTEGEDDETQFYNS